MPAQEAKQRPFSSPFGHQQLRAVGRTAISVALMRSLFNTEADHPLTDSKAFATVQPAAQIAARGAAVFAAIAMLTSAVMLTLTAVSTSASAAPKEKSALPPPPISIADEHAAADRDSDAPSRAIAPLEAAPDVSAAAFLRTFASASIRPDAIVEMPEYYESTLESRVRESVQSALTARGIGVETDPDDANAPGDAAPYRLAYSASVSAAPRRAGARSALRLEPDVTQADRVDQTRIDPISDPGFRPAISFSGGGARARFGARGARHDHALSRTGPGLARRGACAAGGRFPIGDCARARCGIAGPLGRNSAL